MNRDAKYKPVSIKIYCPACGQTITRNEWMDYGMHLRCTQSYKKQNQENTMLRKEIRTLRVQKVS